MSASEMVMLEEELDELRAEVERLRSILADYEEMTDRLDAQAVGMTAAFDARDEDVERLRVERDHFREAWAAAQVRLDCGTDAMEAVREDRAALIRWLRLPPQTYLDGYLLVGSIERGEHRREEKP